MKSKVMTCLFVGAAINAFLALSVSAAEAPKPRSRSEVEAVLAKAPKAPPKRDLRELNVVLVAFKKDHGLRIDLALGTEPVTRRVQSVTVDRAERDPAGGEGKPSDHAPVVVALG